MYWKQWKENVKYKIYWYCWNFSKLKANLVRSKSINREICIKSSFFSYSSSEILVNWRINKKKCNETFYRTPLLSCSSSEKSLFDEALYATLESESIVSGGPLQWFNRRNDHLCVGSFCSSLTYDKNQNKQNTVLRVSTPRLTICS